MTAIAASFIEAVSPQQWLLIIAVMLIGLVFLWSRGSRRPLDGSPKQYRREIDSAAGRSEAIKRDMEQLLVELEALAKKMNGQVDTSFAKLQQMIADADRRIPAMRILIAECKRLAGDPSAGTHPSGGTDPTAGPGQPVPGVEASPQSQQADGPAASQFPLSAEGEAAGSPEPRRRRIYELADRGLSPVQIAQELREQPGEVELILNLRKAGQ